MSELIYIDTNVWIDYFLNRRSKLRPIGEFAFELFRKSIDCKYKIVLSDWLKKELKLTNHFDSFRILEKDLIFHNKVVEIKSTYKDFINARKTKHWQDALHELLAIKSGAKYLVTRNINDFSGEKISIVFPEFL